MTWQILRSKRLKIDGYKCQYCGSPFRLQVHHLKYPAELGTEDLYGDLITLCDSCHEKIEAQKKAHREAVQQYWDSQHERWETEKQERRKRAEHHQQLIRQFIREHKDQDLSNVGKGKKNYCDLNVIKADFYPYMRSHGAEEFEDGYISGTSHVQEYFRNRRYEVILDMLDKGYDPWTIHCRTLFSEKMVNKVSENPENAKALLKKERNNND